MDNFNYLVQLQEEQSMLNEEVYGGESVDDPTIGWDIEVKNIKKGQQGFVTVSVNLDGVEFIVPEEEYEEYKVSKEEFNRDFVFLAN